MKEDMNRLQASSHASARRFLRVAGPVLVMIGFGFTVIGLASFFSAFGSFGLPRLFWCSFIGMPVLFVGAAMSMFGFMGAIARYQAGEIAPVAKDAVNYMADGTKDGVRTVARAVAEGIEEAKQKHE